MNMCLQKSRSEVFTVDGNVTLSSVEDPYNQCLVRVRFRMAAPMSLRRRISC